MNRSLLAAAAALCAFNAPAGAADLDRQLGLIVSGVVEQWAGVQIINNSPQIVESDETVFATGGAGRLNLPLGDNLSIQSDAKYEYNTKATESPAGSTDTFGPRYSFQGAVHLSWRDPSGGLFGVFGGAGTTDFGTALADPPRSDVAFVGGEAQVYLDSVTLYAQGGYVDFSARDFQSFRALSDGLFARGVFRWFMTNDSRIQIEGTYMNVDYATSDFGEMEAFSVSARYDFTLAGLPIVGDTPIYIGYRGTFRDRCVVSNGDPFDVDDHTIMIGTSYSFSGDLLTVDRQGATLDTPDFDYGCFVSLG
ncbi:hypothetical protein [Anderseniella sp. Alg231-50]|uniref:hypothetical protein n=1 Tax=Anderseniella sp. Alg231-50 TaxID=1922226 RepID=UPI000D54F7A1